ncbi:hypothetical protein CAPTEDRAFT_210035 [Capitella teleta]|uniref:Uncharacterized protein n=1 Tax=Capitella teleta TaxID=283909 RepID=R7V414_CAPTE|nr:hypothetical protein CAPTEDRAFT_210035 [Capitella teleta]|eukprot:ELU13172.1 hypothetical protein CAPTEDRAFT_210035 [Capitella teleta]
MYGIFIYAHRSTNPLPTVPPSIPVPDLPAFDPNDRRSEDRAARLASRIGKVKKHFITMEDPKTAVSEDSEKEIVKEKPKLQPQFNFEVQAKEDYSSYQPSAFSECKFFKKSGCFRGKHSLEYIIPINFIVEVILLWEYSKECLPGFMDWLCKKIKSGSV